MLESWPAIHEPVNERAGSTPAIAPCTTTATTAGCRRRPTARLAADPDVVDAAHPPVAGVLGGEIDQLIDLGLNEPRTSSYDLLYRRHHPLGAPVSSAATPSEKGTPSSRRTTAACGCRGSWRRLDEAAGSTLRHRHADDATSTPRPSMALISGAHCRVRRLPGPGPPAAPGACAAACTASFSSRSGAAEDFIPAHDQHLCRRRAAVEAPGGQRRASPKRARKIRTISRKAGRRLHISDRPDFTDRPAFFVRFMTCSLLC